MKRKAIWWKNGMGKINDEANRGIESFDGAEEGRSGERGVGGEGGDGRRKTGK